MKKSKGLSIFFIVSLILFTISFSIALPILCRFFYYIQIDTLNLDQIYIPSVDGTISTAEIKQAFDELMDYLLLGGTFKTGILAFSSDGASHFEDVRYLFTLDLIILVISTCSIISSLIIVRKGTNYKFYDFLKRTPYFYAGLFTILFFAILGFLVSLNFDAAFVIFHKIFFPGKTNWTFNSNVDEIINILPIEFFMNAAILIGASIIIISILLIGVDGIINFKRSRQPIKIVAIDIDGTLLTSDKRLTEQTVTAIKAASAQGVYVIISSGRPYQGIIPLLTQLDLLNEENYTISFGGALVVNNLSGRPVFDSSLTKDDAIILTNLAKKHNLTSHVFADQKCYLEIENKYSTLESTLNNIPLHYIKYSELGDDAIINKVMFVDDNEKLQKSYSELSPDLFNRYSIVFSAPFFLEFLNPRAQKGVALQELTELLDLDYYNVLAIGDEENDLSMLKYAKVKVAMGNANPKLKKIATYITADNDHNGVAQAINKFVIKEKLK